jgi:hypothetical protein
MPEWMATRILALLLGLSGGFATHYTLLILGVIHAGDDIGWTGALHWQTSRWPRCTSSFDAPALHGNCVFLTIRKLRTGEKGNFGLQANKTRWVGEKKGGLAAALSVANGVSLVRRQ